ncbi:uroporphyrinogen decarboxylase (URO-D) [Oxobacter pfennigii]|uniref:Uroporphyrinogen decarboxylase (URO-D) n=1 Tax=Oxobacter pfennigii TaxID=36849 RepID=A0A0N8NTC0_9CLOT|nr:uroporphyrinogen decarboxylase family protein [Oxobacter pfennigii]KPU44408.1 uroporphyrinogen decarboxylase (URO-D) [Oxobacter pfennigii]
MTRPKFDPKEFETVGMYPPPNTDMFKDRMSVMPPEPKLNKPITPKENWKLIFEGKKPYWIPRSGWVYSEVNVFRPRMHPDNVVTHIIFDGEPPYEYPGDIMRSSWFDLDWQYVPSAGGATVLPGKPKVPDISKWEEYISIPNLDDLDWKGCAEKNKEYLNTDKMNQLGILSGFWERLMSLMDVDNAAIALIDEEQQPGVHRFFDKLADLFIDYIGRMKECCDIDSVLMHDDWGHQNAPFFSVSTAREMLLPYLKRVINYCHSIGLSFELHSCGKNEANVPVFIEAGVDLWCGQPMNDYYMLAKKYKDSTIVFGVPAPAISEGTSEEEIRQIAKDWVEKYKDCRIAANFTAAPPSFSSTVYEFSRIAYQNEE